MHYLTLDTNTWIYLANGTEPVRLLSYIKREVDKHNITILLPEIIIKEWENNKDRAVRQSGLKHFRDVNEAFDRILKLLGDKGEKQYFNFLFDEKDEKDYFKDFIEKFKIKEKEIEEAIADNMKIIEDLFKHKRTEVIKIEDNVILKAGQFALEKKAPFKTKNSFADALIVFSFIDYVKTKSIEGAFFITYNTEDFCEKRGGEKYLHPDLEPEFTNSKSKFYKIVGEALNTIEKDIVSREELEYIREQQEEDEKDRITEYCLVCDTEFSNNEVQFGKQFELIDERFKMYNANQTEFEFAKDLPSVRNEKHYKKINVGYCNWCNTEHLKCVQCGTLIAILEEEYNRGVECDGCGIPYFVEMHNASHDNGKRYRYRILNSREVCQKCGSLFVSDENGINFCEECENEYAYGE